MVHAHDFTSRTFFFGIAKLTCGKDDIVCSLYKAFGYPWKAYLYKIQNVLHIQTLERNTINRTGVTVMLCCNYIYK